MRDHLEERETVLLIVKNPVKICFLIIDLLKHLHMDCHDFDCYPLTNRTLKQLQQVASELFKMNI